MKKYMSYALLSVGVISLALAVVVSCNRDSSAAKVRPNIVHKDAGQQGVVAKIGNRTVTEDELVGDAYSKFYEIWQSEYNLKMDRVKEIMTNTLIGEEAKKANLSNDEFIKKKVTKGDIKISDAEYNAFIKERNVPTDRLNDDLKKRILAFMEEDKKSKLIQNYVADLTKKSPVEIYFKKPKAMVVEVGNSPTHGSGDAGVTIVEFSDFQCPFCSRGADVVNQIKKKYGSKVKIAFRNFPLPMHPEAKPAAEMSLCINEQGTDKFWKFHDIVFKNQQKMDGPSLESYAKQSGADVGKVKSCIESKKFEQVLASDMAYGEKIGVRSTPTFFVNGQLVSGAQPIEVFSEIIDEEMASKKN